MLVSGKEGKTMNELQIGGCMMLVLAAAYVGSIIADKRERARRKAEHRRRVKAVSRHRVLFLRNMRDSDSMWDRQGGGQHIVVKDPKYRAAWEVEA